MQLKNSALYLCLLISLSACSSSDPLGTDDILLDSDMSGGNETPTVLQAPTLAGQLSFSSEQTIDLDPIIDAAGLQRVSNFVISNSGDTVRANALNDKGETDSILIVDTNSASVNWLFTDMGGSTRILFNAYNTAVASYSVNCTDTQYTPLTNTSLFDITSLVANERCIADNAKISADGNVILLETYTKGTQQNEQLDTSTFAYSVNTANLLPFPDVSLVKDDVTLSPLANIPFGFESILSNDGQQYLVKQWWTGLDNDGNEVQQVGAVLWNTNNGDWLVRGQADDTRGCTPTSKVGCNPPYFYAMSNDGKVQYFSYPTDVQLDNGTPPTRLETIVAVTDTNSQASIEISDTGQVNTLDTNLNGDLLLLESASNSSSIQPGYALYQRSSDTLLSLNNTLNGCDVTSGTQITFNTADCDFSNTPYSSTGDAEHFTGDGQHLLLRYINRFTSDGVQSIDDFIIDINSEQANTLPTFYSANPNWVNGDGSVFIGNTEFPDFDLLIGKL